MILTLLVVVLLQCTINGDVGFDLYDGNNFESTTAQEPSSSTSNKKFIRRTTTISRITQQNSIGNVTSFTLINTDTNLPILDLVNNTIVNIAAYGTTNFNIQAFVTMPIGYIKFGFNTDSTYKTESNGPYTLCGNVGTRFLPCSELTVGKHTVSATPYLNGVAGIRRTVVFTIVNVPAKTCSIPRLLGTGWDDFLPLYPIRVKETHGTMIGTDIIIISGFINDLANATNHTYARDVSGVKGTAWRRMDDLPVASGITHAAVTVANKRIFFCGGFYGGNPGVHRRECYRYDHLKPPGLGQQWARIANLPNGGTGGGGMVYDTTTNALYYAAGGTRNQTNPTRDIYDINGFFKYELDNPRKGWTDLGSCPYNGNHISTVTAYDKFGMERHYFLGGQIGKDECKSNLNNVYEWNAITKKWIKRANMLFPRGHSPSSTIPINCGFVVAGGSVNSPTGCFRQTSDISYYNIETNQWTWVGNLSNPVNTPVCTIRDGYMYHVSGTANRRRITGGNP